ncbi:hypothetical protein A1QO_04040 [Vibrio genomosp. F10 str. ZF-129]|uniref:Uncharacterized protein n=1 Tax=Vibrio genomosp. F10 str. ZF-129 TaxID=1187848 RepID=A0A1E5BIZ7_9VIBR|nr:hypothetical protein [Vibrio genomosp. F10]OEE37282.1 hypothetical protein A1QO_04040 [Vibrio genomosp. F10 str. ZF-129]
MINQHPKEYRVKKTNLLNPILSEEFEKVGWTLEKVTSYGCVAAQREVQSIGKVDDALIYKVTGDEFTAIVKANYDSCGNNVLSTTSLSFSWSISEDDFRKKATEYASDVDKVINGTKMVALKRSTALNE